MASRSIGGVVGDIQGKGTIAPISTEDVVNNIERQPPGGQPPGEPPGPTEPSEPASSPLVESMRARGLNVAAPVKPPALADVKSPEERPAISQIQQQQIEQRPGLSQRVEPTGELHQSNDFVDMVDPVEGAIDRGNRLAQRFESDQQDALTYRENRPEQQAALLAGEQDIYTPTQVEGEAETTGITPQELVFSPRVLDAGNYNAEGKLVADPALFPVASLVTENFFRTGAYSTDQDTQDQAEIGNIEAIEALEEPSAQQQITRAQGNARLGENIWREWKREQGTLQGEQVDTSQLQQPTNKEYEALGGLFKELYHRSNPDLFKQVDNTSQKVYQLTDQGADLVEATHNALNKPFASEEVVPLHQVSPTAEHQFEGKTLTRSETTKVQGQKRQGAMAIIDEAKQNLHQMPRVADTKREGMMYQLGVQALLLYQQGDSSVADIFDIGDAKLESLQGEKAEMQRKIDAKDDNAPSQKQVDAYNPEKILRQEQLKFIESLNTVARYASKVNYNTFYVQLLNGRLGMQQNKLNPQTNKVVRFVYGSGNQVQVNPKSSGPINNNFKELVATHLYNDKLGIQKVKGKHLKPEARRRAFDELHHKGDLDKFFKIGRDINANRLGGDALLETRQQAAQITQGPDGIQIPPALQSMQLNLHPDTVKELLKHGNEAPYMMELFATMADWKDKYDNGGTFRTSIEAEMDGITHGPSSNALALGNKKMARRSGTLNDLSDTFKLLDTDEKLGDARDSMKFYMFENGYTDAKLAYGHEKAPALTATLARAMRDRENFLKKSPMTLIYGQQIENLKQHVEIAMVSGPMAKDIQRVMKQGGLSHDETLEFLHGSLVDSIEATLGSQTFEVSQLLRANNIIASMTDIPMTYVNPMGFDSYIGGRRMDPESTSRTQFKIKNPGEGKAASATIYHYENYGSGAAERRGIAGGYGHGRSIPAVVQSYDGNMISKTATGRSHNKLSRITEQRGYTPSYTPIFDAFKVDLAQMDLVRDEANNNWLNGIKEGNYVDQLMNSNGWAETTFKEWRKDMLELPNTPINLDQNPQYDFFKQIVSWEEGNNGYGKLMKLIQSTTPLEQDNRGKKRPMSDERAVDAVGKFYKRVGIDYQKGSRLTELTPQQIVKIADQLIGGVQLFTRNHHLANNVTRARNELFRDIDVKDVLQVDLG